MSLLIGQNKKGGGTSSAAANKALVQNATQYGHAYNLYQVMEEVKADPRIKNNNYSAIMLCQYYKGYNSLQLTGGAIAFLTSDGDYYSGDTTHYWHDTEDEHFDRWVAMIFLLPTNVYSCSNANICPRAILIDGTIADIKLGVNNTRVAWIDATEGSSCNRLFQTQSSYTNQWNRQLVIRGINTFSTGTLNLSGATSAILGHKTIAYEGIRDGGNTLVILKFENLETCTGNGILYPDQCTQLQELICPKLIRATSVFRTSSQAAVIATNLRKLVLPKITYLPHFSFMSYGDTTEGKGWADLIHIEFGKDFNTSINLRMCNFANCIKTDANDLVENVKEHPDWSNLDQFLYNFEHLIVDKLADLTGKDAKTITLYSVPYAVITDAIKAKMTAKNWNLASA